MKETIVYDSQEQFDKGIEIYENTFELFKEIEDRESRVKVMLSLGVAYRKNDDETVQALCKNALNVIDSNFTLEGYRTIFFKMRYGILKIRLKLDQWRGL